MAYDCIVHGAQGVFGIKLLGIGSHKSFRQSLYALTSELTALQFFKLLLKKFMCSFVWLKGVGGIRIRISILVGWSNYLPSNRQRLVNCVGE